jgi:uncharacterized protein (TIGR02266 family)
MDAMNQEPPPQRSERPEARIQRLPSVLPSNRRTAPRYAVELDVTFGSEHNFYAGFIENMSVGGVFMATHQLKPVGELMDVTIYLPDASEPVVVRGVVRWVREYNEASDTPPGLGVQFVDVDPVGLAAIQAFLQHRQPLFYDD